jgi:hypothetical protein
MRLEGAPQAHHRDAREEHARLLGSDRAPITKFLLASVFRRYQSAGYIRPAPDTKKTRAIDDDGDNVCTSGM